MAASVPGVRRTRRSASRSTSPTPKERSRGWRASLRQGHQRGGSLDQGDHAEAVHAALGLEPGQLVVGLRQDVGRGLRHQEPVDGRVHSDREVVGEELGTDADPDLGTLQPVRSPASAAAAHAPRTWPAAGRRPRGRSRWRPPRRREPWRRGRVVTPARRGRNVAAAPASRVRSSGAAGTEQAGDRVGGGDHLPCVRLVSLVHVRGVARGRPRGADRAQHVTVRVEEGRRDRSGAGAPLVDRASRGRTRAPRPAGPGTRRRRRRAARLAGRAPRRRCSPAEGRQGWSGSRRRSAAGTAARSRRSSSPPGDSRTGRGRSGGGPRGPTAWPSPGSGRAVAAAPAPPGGVRRAGSMPWCRDRWPPAPGHRWSCPGPPARGTGRRATGGCGARRPCSGRPRARAG